MVDELRLDAAHDAVCTSRARHLVVVAPPGTGKTCLSVRLASIMASGLGEASRVLLVTFSNQARTQLEREAARQLSASQRSRIEITNYHRLAWSTVMAYRRALQLPMDVDIGSRARRVGALRGSWPELVDRIASGAVDALAEFAFPEFRDDRTPEPEVLERLLSVVDAEILAGRLVFDDLVALLWQLLERFPSLVEAISMRYPIVIADEHQDASALQDAIVRRLGRDRLVILADPLQLIHGFRGASPDRLQRHERECQERLELTTPHRWYGNSEVSEWLLAFREQVQGGHASAPIPSGFRVRRTQAQRGWNALKYETRLAVHEAFDNQLESVAVLVRSNSEANDLRAYLARQGLFPRQLGGEFEEARADIEQLPLLNDSQSVAQHAVARIGEMVPLIPAAVLEQCTARCEPRGLRLKQAGAEARRLLMPLQPIYSEGPHAYLGAIVAALDTCAKAGFQLPRPAAVRALRVAAQAFGGGTPQDLTEALRAYSDSIIRMAHVAPGAPRGLYVMTAHQSKGKEFDAVVLADLAARYWPGSEEDRLLFYVAVTRATRNWAIIAPDDRASPLLELLPS